MSKYLVSYDLNAGHKAFLTAAEPQGLLYVMDGYDSEGSQYLSRLPNTTLWGIFSTKGAAQKAFDVALATASISHGSTILLEKRVIAGFDEYSITSDKMKVPDKRWIGPTAFETCRRHQVNDPFFR